MTNDKIISNVKRRARENIVMHRKNTY